MTIILCLKIQILATFNTERTQIDKALLRKGRLITDYKFENLNIKYFEYNIQL